jgi:FMN phosphatase YigB (HAD superfamily)
MRWPRSARRCRGGFPAEFAERQGETGIITNGFTALQQIRLERTGLRDHLTRW